MGSLLFLKVKIEQRKHRLDSPLLNDNKITGAKNVLLLIVSGSNEITLDEIGK
jgi:cell division protein FtsZ